MSKIKHPWRVEYVQLYPEWHKHAQPRVVDADGNIVVVPPQFVHHPGEHDVVANLICDLVVTAVNAHIEALKRPH